MLTITQLPQLVAMALWEVVWCTIHAECAVATMTRTAMASAVGLLWLVYAACAAALTVNTFGTQVPMD
jgi:hypothetical protein